MYADNMELPAFAHRTLQQSIDISWPPGPQQQTCSSGVWRANGTYKQVDRQTDGQTLYRFIDLAPHTMWAAPKITGLVAKYIHEKWPAEEDDVKAKTLCIISS